MLQLKESQTELGIEDTHTQTNSDSTFIGTNVRGEPVFSVMAAGWFCEKSVRLNWESGGCGTGVFKKKPGFQPVATILKRGFYLMNCEIGRFHSV
jgi:hypothetical protein